MGLVVLNEQSAPDFPWFPVPIIGLLVAAIVGMQRWRPIGLAIPTDVPWGRVYGFAVAITVVGIVVSILQGAYHGYVRVSEGVQTDVSPAFALLYWFVMSLFAVVLAEAAFRGVMQTRLMAVLGVWPAIVIVGIVNTAAHRWNIELFQQWLGISALSGPLASTPDGCPRRDQFFSGFRAVGLEPIRPGRAGNRLACSNCRHRCRRSGHSHNACAQRDCPAKIELSTGVRPISRFRMTTEKPPADSSHRGIFTNRAHL